MPNIYYSKSTLRNQILPAFRDIKTTCDAAIDCLQSVRSDYVHQMCAADEYEKEAQYWLNELSKTMASIAEVLELLQDEKEA